MNTKTVIIVLATLLLSGCAVQTEAPLKVGAILPMSGPTAVWGENLKNGMELAREELAVQGVNIDIIYEDSQAKPDVALTAYRKLKELDGVNMVFSAFSRVSVPLVSVADNDKMPIMMTVVAAKGVAEKSPYSFRFYSNERQYVEPQFAWMNSSVYNRVAVLWINDEFGSSVHDVILEQAQLHKMSVVADENYDPNSVDFRTQLTKIKVANPKAILFVGSVPVEISNALKQVRELGITADFIENSAALAQPASLQAAGSAAEGAITLAFPFSLGRSGGEFRQAYKQRFSTEPNFAAAFGYDMVKLIGLASDGHTMSGEELAQRIVAVKTFESLNGPVAIQPSGEINPAIEPAKVMNGSLVALF